MSKDTENAIIDRALAAYAVSLYSAVGRLSDAGLAGAHEKGAELTRVNALIAKRKGAA